MSARYDSMLFAAYRFYMMVYDIINYHDVTSATNLYVFVENVLFTDI